MSEAGGPSTQSGIRFQNSVAALYLGRLCDVKPRQLSEQVVGVRTEAPTQVDDVVVEFADAHRAYIQCKECLQVGSPEWRQLWDSFARQFLHSDFRRGTDYLSLWLGASHPLGEKLTELAERASTSTSQTEWMSRLNQKQLALLENVRSLLSSALWTDTDQLTFFASIHVENVSRTRIERDYVAHWVPETNISQTTLFALFRDRVGGTSRIRGTFEGPSLRRDLEVTDRVVFVSSPELEDLRARFHASGALLRHYPRTFGATGIHLERDVVGEMFTWIMESGFADRVAVVLDHAGAGKTVVLADLLQRLEHAGVTVLAIKADQKLIDVTTPDDLRKALDLDIPLPQALSALSANESVVLMIDQVDALSLSLARDQRTLNVLLDLIAQVRELSGVKVLVSCRTFDLNSDPRLHRMSASREFGIGSLSDDDVSCVLKAVDANAADLTPTTRELLRVPLHLDLVVRVMETVPTNVGRSALLRSQSVQHLYAQLWRHVIRKEDKAAPPVGAREQVLTVLTDSMNRRQRTTLPKSVLSQPAHIHLEASATWLASAGILVDVGDEWAFLHQTFFDYSLARQFAQGNTRLIDEVLGSDQGLTQRPFVVNVLTYLRGGNATTYLKQIHALLVAPKLREHLRQLLIQWLGMRPDPTAEEFAIARRLFLTPTLRRELLAAMSGNLGWLRLLSGPVLTSLLMLEEEELDVVICPFLGSFLDSPAQREIIVLLRARLDAGETWGRRIDWMLMRIRSSWTPDAADLYAARLDQTEFVNVAHVHDLDDVARVRPVQACRVIRRMLDQVLDGMLQADEGSPNRFYGIGGALDVLEGSTLESAIGIVSTGVPREFLDACTPWMERVCRLQGGPAVEAQVYMYDGLCSGWRDTTHVVAHSLIIGMVAALVNLGRTNAAQFHVHAAVIEMLPYRTPQQLIARAYAELAPLLVTHGLDYLLADKRRLSLGDSEEFETRHLIRALSVHLDDNQFLQLEEFIVEHRDRYWGVEGLQWSGLRQLRLLRCLPLNRLSDLGRRTLEELDRKFPDYRSSDEPNTFVGGAVQSPIEADAIAKMSDKAWLGAMAKYAGKVEHHEFLKGGAYQLAGHLGAHAQKNPERFVRLFQSVGDDVDSHYVQAMVAALAEVDGQSDELFVLALRFGPKANLDTRIAIARALKKQASTGIPADLLDQLELWVRSEDDYPQHDVERDPYEAYINSVRGCSLEALMRGLDADTADPQSATRKWNVLEDIAQSGTIVLRAGAITEVLIAMHRDRGRWLDLFGRLLAGHPGLLRSQYAQDVLYHGIYRNFTRMLPYMDAMLVSGHEPTERRGAELLCLAAISPAALISEEERATARARMEACITGKAEWRRGAARILSHNLMGSSGDFCERGVLRLLNDEDAEVGRTVSAAFRNLPAQAVVERRRLIEDYAASRAFRTISQWFGEFMWEHGVLEPEWALGVVESALNNTYTDGAERHGATGGQSLVRLVVSIYTDPTSEDLRQRCMDAFDKMMGLFALETQSVLLEWDQR